MARRRAARYMQVECQALVCGHDGHWDRREESSSKCLLKNLKGKQWKLSATGLCQTTNTVCSLTSWVKAAKHVGGLKNSSRAKVNGTIGHTPLAHKAWRLGPIEAQWPSCLPWPKCSPIRPCCHASWCFIMFRASKWCSFEPNEMDNVEDDNTKVCRTYSLHGLPFRDFWKNVESIYLFLARLWYYSTALQKSPHALCIQASAPFPSWSLRVVWQCRILRQLEDGPACGHSVEPAGGECHRTRAWWPRSTGFVQSVQRKGYHANQV